MSRCISMPSQFPHVTGQIRLRSYTLFFFLEDKIARLRPGTLPLLTWIFTHNCMHSHYALCSHFHVHKTQWHRNISVFKCVYCYLKCWLRSDSLGYEFNRQKLTFLFLTKVTAWDSKEARNVVSLYKSSKFDSTLSFSSSLYIRPIAHAFPSLPNFAQFELSWWQFHDDDMVQGLTWWV